MKVRDLLAGVPEGVYQLRLVESEMKSSQAGRPMYALRFEIADGPYAGREIRDWLVLTAEGFRRWAQLYLAVGGSEQDEVRDISDLAQRCLSRLQTGKTIWAEVASRAGPDGLPRPRVQAYWDGERGRLLADQYARRDSQVPF